MGSLCCWSFLHQKVNSSFSHPPPFSHLSSPLLLFYSQMGSLCCCYSSSPRMEILASYLPLPFSLLPSFCYQMDSLCCCSSSPRMATSSPSQRFHPFSDQTENPCSSQVIFSVNYSIQSSSSHPHYPSSGCSRMHFL